MIESLEIQKIIINSIKDIEYIKKNNVGVFTSVPSKAKMPYIKIASIFMNNSQQNANIKNFTFDLFVVADGKNNSQIFEIMECLFSEIEEKINQYIDKESLDIEILNVFNIKYNIDENFQNNFWNGHFYVDIDVLS